MLLTNTVSDLSETIYQNKAYYQHFLLSDIPSNLTTIPFKLQ